MELFVDHFVGGVVVAILVGILCQWRPVRLRPALCHGLWMIALVRLVTPPLAQIPVMTSSAMRLATVYEPLSDSIEKDRERSPTLRPTEVSGDQRLLQVTDDSKHVRANQSLVKSQTDLEQSLDAGARGTKSPQRLPSPTLASLLLAGSMIVTVAWWITSIRQFLRVRRLFRGNPVATERTRQALYRAAKLFPNRRTPDLFIVDAPLTPMLWAGGTSRAAIILPRPLAEALDDQQLDHVMAHELAHWCRWDHWTNLLGLIVVSLVWWNPVAWFARREMLAAAEASCDAMAVNRLGHLRKAYARTLLSVIDFIERTNPQQHAFGTSFGSSRIVRRRFLNICDSRVKSNLSFLGVACIIAGAATLFVLPVRSQESAPPVPHVGMSPEVARDLITVLGDDFGRVTGLPLKLVTDPKGKWVYLPETNGLVSVYDTDTLRRVKNLPLHEERCLEVAVIDEGRKLVSISIDGNARLWDVTAELPRQLDELKMLDKTGWLSMSPSKSGERFAFRSDQSLTIVDIGKNQFAVRKRMTIDGDFQSSNIPFHYALSPDGRWLATNENQKTSTTVEVENGRKMSLFDSSLVLWDLTKDEPQQVSEVQGKDVSSLIFTPDSKHLVSTDPYFLPKRRIHEWHIQNGKLVPGADRELSIGSPFSKELIFSSNDQLWARNLGKELSITANVGKETVSRGTVAAGQRIFSATFIGDDIILVADSLLQRWDWRDGRYQQRKMPSGHHSPVIGLHFDSDSQSLLSFSQDATLEWNISNLRHEQNVVPVKLEWRHVDKVCPWPAKNGFVIKHQRDNIEYITGIAKSASGKLIEIFSKEMKKGSEYSDCWSFAMHPTEPILATGHHNSKAFLWDVSGDEPTMLTKWGAHQSHVCNLAFSPDGNQIVSVGWDHKTTLWEIEPDEARAGMIPKGTILGSHADIVRSVAWSQDGKYLASGGQDGQILLWKFENGEVSQPISLIDAKDGEPIKNSLSSATIGSLVFSKSGRQLLSSDGRGRASIWSIESGEQIKKWQLPGWVWQSRFSPDETLVAIANNDGTIYLVRSPMNVPEK